MSLDKSFGKVANYSLTANGGIAPLQIMSGYGIPSPPGPSDGSASGLGFCMGAGNQSNMKTWLQLEDGALFYPHGTREQTWEVISVRWIVSRSCDL